jgi:uncharacterized protein YlzI (FlbEa/FlbD family)
MDERARPLVVTASGGLAVATPQGGHMPCKITTLVNVEGFVVQEDFDEVIDRIYPINAPSSAIESRGSMIYTLEEGRRLLISPNAVQSIEENPED